MVRLVVPSCPAKYLIPEPGHCPECDEAYGMINKHPTSRLERLELDQKKQGKGRKHRVNLRRPKEQIRYEETEDELHRASRGDIEVEYREPDRGTSVFNASSLF